MSDYLDAINMTIGRRYHAELQDCCIIGEFTATLSAVDVDEEDGDLVALRFDNGVTLTTWWQVTFKEAT